MAFLPIVSLVLMSILGMGVVFINRKKVLNILFGFFSFSITLWLLFDFLTDRAKTLHDAILFSRLSFVGPILIPLSFLLFTSYFPQGKKIENRHIIYYLSVAPFVLLLLSWTSLIVQSVSFENGLTTFGARVNFTAGWGYYLFVGYFILYMFFAFYNLLRRYKGSFGRERQQIIYLFTGIIISLIISIVTNILLPLLGKSDLAKVGPSSTIIDRKSVV